MKISVLPHQIMTIRSRPLFGLEAADVGADLLGQIHLVGALLDVRAVEPLHVAAVEDRRPGLDGLELGRDLLEQRRLEHAGGAGRLVAVVLEDVPAAEHDVVERGERDEVLDERRCAPRCACRDGSVPIWVSEPIGCGDPLANGHDAGDERRADGTEADEQDAEFSVGRGDFSLVVSRARTISLAGIDEDLPRRGRGPHALAARPCVGPATAGEPAARRRRRRRAPVRGDGRQGGPHGRACAIVGSATAAARVEAAAATAGVLVEVELTTWPALPVGDGDLRRRGHRQHAGASLAASTRRPASAWRRRSCAPCARRPGARRRPERAAACSAGPVGAPAGFQEQRGRGQSRTRRLHPVRLLAEREGQRFTEGWRKQGLGAAPGAEAG